jgi:hypothetical protein
MAKKPAFVEAQVASPEELAAFDAAMRADQEAEDWSDSCDESGAERLQYLRDRAERLWRAHDKIAFPEQRCGLRGTE